MYFFLNEIEAWRGAPRVAPISLEEDKELLSLEAMEIILLANELITDSKRLN